MRVESEVSLKPYHTFGIDTQAAQFTRIQQRGQLDKILQLFSQNNAFLILGGGSNVLFTKPFEGIVIKNELKGIRIIKRLENETLVEAASGESWHEFVCWTLKHHLYGLENLSLIPGSVGASPMQNIGAYGREIKDVFESLEALNLKTGAIEHFSAAKCQFGYRESIFKHEYKGQYFILSVTFRLQHLAQVHTTYGAIDTVLKSNGILNPNPQDVANAVIKIRSEKLPDPAIYGNAGSFFKNPEIDASAFFNLQKQYPQIVHYIQASGKYKLAAGWLIEQCGLKGYTHHGAAVHTAQALVLINASAASGTAVLELSKIVQQRVFERFGVQLQTEVNIL